jgi:hypothetical protein
MPDKDKTFNPSNTVYTPLEVANAGLDYIKKLRDTKARSLGIGIPDIKDYFSPMQPGQVAAIIGQTSHYKSGLLHYIEHCNARQLMEEERNDESLIHVSVEEGIEEQAFLEFARHTGEDSGLIARGECQDWEKLIQATIKIGTIPIYRIGDSIARAEEMPNLYMSNIIRAIQFLVKEFNTKPAGIYFDYLQAFPIDPEIKNAAHDQQRRLQVRADIYRLRQASSYFNCPVWVAVQAKQKLEGAFSSDFYMPGIYDGEESSSIAQRCDRILTLWLPKMTHPQGKQIIHGFTSFTVEENLLFIRVAKQRGGLPSGRMWKCRVDFNKNIIAPETELDR